MLVDDAEAKASLAFSGAYQLTNDDMRMVLTASALRFMSGTVRDTKDMPVQLRVTMQQNYFTNRNGMRRSGLCAQDRAMLCMCSFSPNLRCSALQVGRRSNCVACRRRVPSDVRLGPHRVLREQHEPGAAAATDIAGQRRRPDCTGADPATTEQPRLRVCCQDHQVTTGHLRDV
jgi:hypothetical protein